MSGCSSEARVRGPDEFYNGSVVTNLHDVAKAVLISLGEFDIQARGQGAKLNPLSAAFDALLAGMQTPSAKAGMSAAFDAPPKELGRAAVLAAGTHDNRARILKVSLSLR